MPHAVMLYARCAFLPLGPLRAFLPLWSTSCIGVCATVRMLVALPPGDATRARPEEAEVVLSDNLSDLSTKSCNRWSDGTLLPPRVLLFCSNATQSGGATAMCGTSC